MSEVHSSQSVDPEQQLAVLVPGALFEGKYIIQSVIGQGGMGVVYKAEHEMMGRPVAIKCLRAEMSLDSRPFERFQNEAKAVSALKHQNIVTIYDFGLAGGHQPYIVMDYLDGISLDRALARFGTMDVATFFKIISQACSALSHAHKRGIVHRDLKDANLMLVQEEDKQDVLKVVDFGLAKALDDSEQQRLTRTGMIVGSPHYMSPEQCQGLPFDHRADIYALGCVMYKCLTGSVPFNGGSALGTINLQISEEPRSFAETNPNVNVPKALERIVLRALEKEPERRQQTMLELLEELRGVCDQPGTSLRATSLTGALGITSDSSKAPAIAPTVQPAGAISSKNAPTPRNFDKSVPSRGKLDKKALVLMSSVAVIGAAVIACAIYSQSLLHQEPTTTNVSKDQSSATKESNITTGDQSIATKESNTTTGDQRSSKESRERKMAGTSELSPIGVPQKKTLESKTATTGELSPVGTPQKGSGGVEQKELSPSHSMVQPPPKSHSQTSTAESAQVNKLKSLLSMQKQLTEIETLEYQANLAFEKRDWGKGAYLLEVCIRLQHQRHLDQSRIIPNQFNLLNAYKMQLRTTDVERVLAQLVSTYDRFPSKFPQSFNMFKDMGDLCKARLDYKHAEKFYFRAWQIQVQEYGDNDQRTIPTLVALGSAYMDDGKLDQARGPLFKAASLERNLQRDKKFHKPYWPAIIQYVHYLQATHQKDLADRWIEEGIPPRIRARSFPMWRPPQAAGPWPAEQRAR